MEPEIYYTRWIEIDGTQGVTFVPFDIVYSDRNQRTHYPSKKDVSPYYDGNVWQARIVDGYGARLSMAGYLDCTEWTVFDTKEKAVSFLSENYGND